MTSRFFGSGSLRPTSFVVGSLHITSSGPRQAASPSGKGQTLWIKGTGLALAALLLAACTVSRPPPYQPIDGRELIPGREVVVRPNQNVYTIARENHVRMREIIALNALQPPFTIKPGQHLVLPARKGGLSSGGYAPVPSSAPSGHIEAAPLAPIVASPVQSEALSPVRPSSSDAAQPSASPFGTGPSVPEPKAQTEEVSPASGAPQPQTFSSAAPSVAAASSSEQGEAELPVGQFDWPVQGTVLSHFGDNHGVNNDGINIAAPKGAPVVAAAGGIVAYTGNEMKGFGNIILVRHEGGWVSAYAHLDRMAVAKDSVVAPGDMIGTVGTTGGLSTPQLHFEVRKDGNPIDPMTVLKK